MQMLIEKILSELGEDPSREGLKKTPERVTRSLRELTAGYHQDPAAMLEAALFSDPQYNDVVTVEQIPFYSLCEHHMLPFFGEVRVAYQPSGKLVGLSKIPRLIDIFARRLQMQERLTKQVADTLFEVLKPVGVAVSVQAQHFCMQMRGVQKPGAFMTTNVLRGSFESDDRLRREFMQTSNS